jgi:hypothetical protein
MSKRCSLQNSESVIFELGFVCFRWAGVKGWKWGGFSIVERNRSKWSTGFDRKDGERKEPFEAYRLMRWSNT